MDRRSLLACVCVSCASVASPLLAQDEVSLKPVFAVGQELPYSMAMVVNVNQRMGEQDVLETTRAQGITNIKIEEVGSDGALKGSLTFTKIFFEVVKGTEEITYDWPLPLPLGPESPAHKKLGQVLSGAKVSFAVDAKGIVTVSGGFDEFAAEVGKIDPPDPRLLAFFVPDKFAMMLEPIFRVDDAGQFPRSIDKGWQTTQRVDLPPVGALEFTNELSLTNVTPELVRYIARSTVSLLQPETREEGVPTVVYNPDSSATTEAYFDRQKNLLRRRKITSSLRSTWTLGETKIEQVQNSSITTVIMDEHLNMKLDPTQKF